MRELNQNQFPDWEKHKGDADLPGKPGDMTPEQWADRPDTAFHSTTRSMDWVQTNPAMHVGTEAAASQRANTGLPVPVFQLRHPFIGSGYAKYQRGYETWMDEGSNTAFEHEVDTGRQKGVAYENMVEDRYSTSYVVPGLETRTYVQDLRESNYPATRRLAEQMDEYEPVGTATREPRGYQGSLFYGARAEPSLDKRWVRSQSQMGVLTDQALDEVSEKQGYAKPLYTEFFATGTEWADARDEATAALKTEADAGAVPANRQYDYISGRFPVLPQLNPPIDHKPGWKYGVKRR